MGKDTQLTRRARRLLKARANSKTLADCKSSRPNILSPLLSSPLIIRPKDRCCKRTKAQIFEICRNIWALPTENPMNDVLNTFCTPNAPWRVTTIEHGQPGEGWPFNQFYKHVVL
ncbi:MAG: hypothetical protein WBY71_08750 [Nitrososphaeraceae archaeon]